MIYDHIVSDIKNISEKGKNPKVRLGTVSPCYQLVVLLVFPLPDVRMLECPSRVGASVPARSKPPRGKAALIPMCSLVTSYEIVLE